MSGLAQVCRLILEKHKFEKVEDSDTGRPILFFDNVKRKFVSFRVRVWSTRCWMKLYNKWSGSWPEIQNDLKKRVPSLAVLK